MNPSTEVGKPICSCCNEVGRLQYELIAFFSFVAFLNEHNVPESTQSETCSILFKNKATMDDLKLCCRRMSRFSSFPNSSKRASIKFAKSTSNCSSCTTLNWRHSRMVLNIKWETVKSNMSSMMISLDNEIATVRMRAQELHRQWCHKAIEFLEAHMNVFIDAKASDILAIVGRRYKAYCCNAS